MFWIILIVSVMVAACHEAAGNTYTCLKVPSVFVRRMYVIKPRRYDIGHFGRVSYFRGWADVQGQGAANDFCRVVGNSQELLLTCALAGTSGQSDRNYNSARRFEPGAHETWYMKDQDGDGRDDYCRCVKSKTEPNASLVWCTKAGPLGFYGSPEQGGNELTFFMSGTENCEKIKVSPEFGKKLPDKYPPASGDTCTYSNTSTSPFMSVCVAKPKEKVCNVLKRRYDVRDMGWEKYFRGWVDVQGQGGANDYCRMVGYEHIIQFSCALAGTQGQNDRSFNSSEKFMVGVPGTWYMKDEDNDGIDDYCRCLELDGKYQVACTKAGPRGFYGSPEQGGNEISFTLGTVGNCATRIVRPEFGRVDSRLI